MDASLATQALERPQPVRVGVTSQQAGLEEQQTNGPDRGAAAEPRQDVTSDYRLQLKQQKCTQKYGDRTKKGKQNMIRWEDK